MDNPGEILRLCRLCLVKDQVNIPIFEEQGDIRQIFLKISSCLPVKVSRDDQLPKKICDGCLNKLDLLYEFWNTSVNAEKTLLSWLGQAGVKDADEKISAVAQQIAKSAETQVKQEALEDGHAPEVQSFEEEAKDESEAPPPKRARRTAAVKAQINITPESDDDDDMDSAEAMTKVEDETDESDGEDKDPSYGEVPGTSADDQAGPSGVGKDGVEAPKKQEELDNRKDNQFNIILSQEHKSKMKEESNNTNTKKDNGGNFNIKAFVTIDDDEDNKQEAISIDNKTEMHSDNENKNEETPGDFNNVVEEMVLVDDDDETDAPNNVIAAKDIKIPCFKCNMVFSMSDFSAHQAVHQEGKEMEQIATEINCTVCGMSFNTIENLLNHMKVLHFSMWDIWSQYYNWNQMDPYGYPYMQTLVAGQGSSDVIFLGSNYDSQLIPGSSERRWAFKMEKHKFKHKHGHGYGPYHGHHHGHDRHHHRGHSRDHSHGHDYHHHHGHGYGKRFRLLHHREKRSLSPDHKRRSHSPRRERIRRRSPSSPSPKLTLAEQAIRSEKNCFDTSTSSDHRCRRSLSVKRSRSRRPSSPIVIDLVDEGSPKKSRRSPALDDDRKPSQFPLDEWVVADSCS